MKKIIIEYNNIIKNKQELLDQIKSLQQEALYMMKGTCGREEIFKKDFKALMIIKDVIEQLA